MQTKIIDVHPTFPEKDKIIHCARIIRQGGLVVFPTETVYGIAADFNNPKAMARLREVKKRAEEKPFSVLIAQKGLISNYTSYANPIVYKLIDVYWPGPLTVVVPTREEEKTIGLRMSSHPIALRLVAESQCSVAAPSANFEGNPPPLTCQEAMRDLNGLVDIAMDGGSAEIGVASSVVDLTREKPFLLREGIITQTDIDRIAARKTVLFVCTGNSCRSVMAEYLLKQKINDQQDIEVLSAGTGVFLQASASSETLVVLGREGIDASSHQAQPLTNILLHKSDLILVMTRAHRQQILERAPDVEKRVYLLKEFAHQPSVSDFNMDIVDPIGKPAEIYEECMMTIKDAIEKIVKLI